MIITWHDNAEKAIRDVKTTIRPWYGWTLHCTATRQNGKHQAQAVQLWHEQRFNPQLGMGYHFLIEEDGMIAVGLRWRNQKNGAHEKGYNSTHIGIALAGWFDYMIKDRPGDMPTLAQLRSLFALVKGLAYTVGWHAPAPIGIMRFHSESAPWKTCPGTRFHGLKGQLHSAILDDRPEAFLKTLEENKGG